MRARLPAAAKPEPEASRTGVGNEGRSARRGSAETRREARIVAAGKIDRLGSTRLRHAHAASEEAGCRPRCATVRVRASIFGIELQFVPGTGPAGRTQSRRSRRSGVVASGGRMRFGPRRRCCSGGGYGATQRRGGDQGHWPSPPHRREDGRRPSAASCTSPTSKRSTRPNSTHCGRISTHAQRGKAEAHPRSRS